MPNTYMPMLVDHKTNRLPTLKKKQQQWKRRSMVVTVWTSTLVHEQWVLPTFLIAYSFGCCYSFVLGGSWVNTRFLPEASLSQERTGLCLSCWYTCMITLGDPIVGDFREEEGRFVLSLPGLPLWSAGPSSLQSWRCPPRVQQLLLSAPKTERSCHILLVE